MHRRNFAPVMASIKGPAGTVTDLTGSIIRDAIGAYHADHTPAAIGLHRYEFLGAGTIQAAARGQFLVNQGTW